MNTRKLFLIAFLVVAMLSSMAEAEGMFDKMKSAIQDAKATVEEKLGKGNKMADKAAEAADTMKKAAAEAAEAAEEAIEDLAEKTEEL